MTEPRVGRAAFALGLAGLLPQVLACLLLAWAGWLDGSNANTVPLEWGLAIATVYPATILSFLGGIWWGFAMRRDEGQAGLALIAVVPSLMAAALLLAGTLGVGRQPVLLLLGGTIIATLLVDRRLVATTDAPRDWMRLRTPLSLGLGGLTIVAALLVP